MLRRLTSAMFLAALAAAPLAAKDAGPYYRAELAQPAADSQVIAGGELFFTDDNPANVAAARARGWHAHLFEGAAGLEAELVGFGLLG